ncbi:SDR family oxidoreductase [Rhodocytophaga aerolata]|uniref:SDR family oxidoreductase n=1 Tax=Rhodocytophaga aerolata TaxID=455078 RepID=A0ABT8R1H8_9BACT|nr:SDR family oxidoreductase [Rhodocytophaga aerolata]MDO1445949.1 SDR family oxidoreductase [Rhodocytophaga aerolata]
MNKLLVITGGTKGIGRSIIELFAQNGFDIATCARNEKDLEQLKKEVEASFQVTIFTQKADLSNKPEVEKFSAFVKRLNRKIDVLVNNAGYFIPGQIHNEPEGTLESMINIHVYSAYYLTRQLIDNMIENKDGYIVNMCSIASIMAYSNGGSYSVAKFALYGMTKVLREEMKPHGIRVTAILPGATLTASWEGVDLPAERFIKPEDVAQAVYGAYAMSKQSVIEEIIIRPQLGDL